MLTGTSVLSPGVQDDSDTIIAQMSITYEWSDWRASQMWWIQNVFVAPEHRRKGLFKKLYAHAKTDSDAAGAAGVRLYANHCNERAHSAVLFPTAGYGACLWLEALERISLACPLLPC